MVKVSIVHAGARSLIVPVPGGTLTVKPGEKIDNVEILPMSEERRDLYKEKGLIFSGKAAAKKKEGSSAQPNGLDVVALQKALDEAKAVHALALAAAQASGAGDAEKATLTKAVDALEDAEDALEDAGK